MNLSRGIDGDMSRRGLLAVAGPALLGALLTHFYGIVLCLGPFHKSKVAPEQHLR